jgi:chromosome segregation ATPase
MSIGADQLSQARLRIGELEKANQSLQHQLELVNNELQHKNAILTQTNSELTEMQAQYKQVLQKLAEMSQRPSAQELTSQEESLLRSQLREQSVCIGALQNRVWQAEHQNRMYRSQGLKSVIGRCQYCEDEGVPESAKRRVTTTRHRGEFPPEFGRLARIARDIRSDYREIRERLAADLPIEELSRLSHSF